MKKRFSLNRIWLLAVLLGLLVSCAPAEKTVEEAAPTPVPSIAAPTAEPEWHILAVATPTPVPKREHVPGYTALRISEVSVNGCATAKRLFGIEGEWVEVYNASDRAVDLASYSLSDREDKPFKYPLSSGRVLPGRYALIDLKDAPFKFKPGEPVCLTDNDTYLYDVLTLPETVTLTCGRDENGTTVFFRYATPGGANRGGCPVGETMPAFDPKDVYISEVCANGKAEWVEIKNGSDAPVSLKGWHLSRDKEDLNATELSGQIEAGGYYVIDMTLPGSGCRLYLTDGDGFFRDIYATGVLSKGLTSGRDENTLQRLFYAEPTPGAENSAAGYTGYAPDIFFSENSLYQKEAFTLTLTAPDAEIYYTLDGTPPEENGKLYTGPISVTGPTAVRAFAKKDGCLDSPEAIRHYLFEEKHSVPVICLAMDEEDFKKVYKATERNQIVEKLCSVTYYFSDGTCGTSMRAAVKAKGRGSLKFAQKSLTFKLRERYGTKWTDFPLFGRGVNEGLRYRSFCLRSGGQDYNRAIIRDTVVNRAAQNTAVDAVKTQPTAVYVNGEYLGLFMLQEEMNADYYVTHYGLDKDQLDVINQKAGVRNGTVEGFTELRRVAKRSGSSDADYERLCTMLDIDAFTDYTAIQLIVGSTDVLNQKVVQSRDGRMLFKPMLFDEDSAFGSKKTDLMYTYFKSPGFTPSSSDQILAYNDVFKALYRFPTWRTRFWHRTVELLNTNFSPAGLGSIIDDLADEIEPELPRQIRKYRFHESVTAWRSKVNELRGIATGRKSAVYDQLKQYFNINDADIRAYEKEIGVSR